MRNREELVAVTSRFVMEMARYYGCSPAEVVACAVEGLREGGWQRHDRSLDAVPDVALSPGDAAPEPPG